LVGIDLSQCSNSLNEEELKEIMSNQKFWL